MLGPGRIMSRNLPSLINLLRGASKGNQGKDDRISKLKSSPGEYKLVELEPRKFAVYFLNSSRKEVLINKRQSKQTSSNLLIKFFW